jgi:hypothetical protein
MKAAVTMRTALSDPALLGRALAGPSWAAWRVMLIAANGEKLTDQEREIFNRFTGREREPRARVEEAAFLIGRRGGKDRAASVLATYLAAFVNWSRVLAKGERGLVLCIGPDQRQATITRDYIEGVFDASTILSRLIVNRTQLITKHIAEVRAHKAMVFDQARKALKQDMAVELGKISDALANRRTAISRIEPRA